MEHVRRCTMRVGARSLMPCASRDARSCARAGADEIAIGRLIIPATSPSRGRARANGIGKVARREDHANIGNSQCRPRDRRDRKLQIAVKYGADTVMGSLDRRLTSRNSGAAIPGRCHGHRDLSGGTWRT